VEQNTETGEVMTWQKLIDKQEREKASFLAKYGKLGLSRIEGARKLQISLTYMSKLIAKYNIDWPTQEGNTNGSGICKVPGGLDTYIQMAKDGLSQAEVCRKFGVSYQNVQNISQKHKIKFRDGRIKA